jgi:energy-coupling factor transporter transmembrane protein EcfT
VNPNKKPKNKIIIAINIILILSTFLWIVFMVVPGIFAPLPYLMFPVIAILSVIFSHRGRFKYRIMWASTPLVVLAIIIGALIFPYDMDQTREQKKEDRLVTNTNLKKDDMGQTRTLLQLQELIKDGLPVPSTYDSVLGEYLAEGDPSHKITLIGNGTFAEDTLRYNDDGTFSKIKAQGKFEISYSNITLIYKDNYPNVELQFYKQVGQDSKWYLKGRVEGVDIIIYAHK